MRPYRVSWIQWDRMFFRYFRNRSTALRLYGEVRRQGWRGCEVRDIRTNTVIAPE